MIFLLAALLMTGSAFSYSDNDEQKPWLGVMISKLSDKQLKNMDLDNGVEITDVMEDSPAKVAGLEEGDIIISVDGDAVKDPGHLVEVINANKAGDKVDIKYLRAGKKGSVTAELKPRKTDERVFKFREMRKPRAMFIQKGGVYFGVKTGSLTDQLRKYFNVPENTGVLIEEVMDDSPAAKAGVKAGDVLVRFGEKKIEDYTDLKHAVNYFEAGQEVEIKIIRDKKEKTLKTTLEERKMKDFSWHGDKGNFEFTIPENADIKGDPMIWTQEGDEEKIIELYKNTDAELGQEIEVEEFENRPVRKRVKVKIAEDGREI